MGNWSPYSKEWEKQHLQKIIDGAETARLEFEKKPRICKATVRLGQTIMAPMSRPPAKNNW